MDRCLLLWSLCWLALLAWLNPATVAGHTNGPATAIAITSVAADATAQIASSSEATTASANPARTDNPLIFTPEDKNVSIAGHLGFLDDPTGDIALPAAIRAWQQGEFRPLSGALNRGYTKAGSWLHLTLWIETGVESPLLLALRPVYLDRVDVWVQQGADPGDPASYRRFSLGDHTPIAQRPEPKADMALDILPPDAPARTTERSRINLFIQVASTSTHSLDGALYSHFVHHRQAKLATLLQGAYVATALALALVNLILAFRLREAVHGYYSAYLLALGIGYAAIEGLINQLIPSNAHLLSDHLVGLASGLSFSLISLMIMQLFRTHRRYPKSHAFLWLMLVSGLLTTLASGTTWYGQIAQINFLLGMIFLCLAIGLAWVRMRAGDPAGRLFVIAFSASFFGGMISFSRILGLVPSTDLTVYAVQVTSLVHMMLMTLALSERVLAAEQKALDAARDAERSATELVKERTEDLAQSKRALEQTLLRERDLRREQAAFIDTISHEYRTPLAILKTNLDIMNWQGSVEEGRLMSMKGALQRLSQIFSDTLTAHHLGRPPGTSLELLDLRDLLDGAIADFQRYQPEIDICFEPGNHPVLANVDRRMMDLVLLNLLQNAGKYLDQSSPDAGIDIWFERIEQGWALHLSNPVDPAIELDRSRLALRRFRAPAHRDNEPSGQGLGLYLVRRGVLDMHGTFEILPDPADRFEIIIRLPS